MTQGGPPALQDDGPKHREKKKKMTPGGPQAPADETVRAPCKAASSGTLLDPRIVKRSQPAEHYIMAKTSTDEKSKRVTGCTRVTSTHFVSIVQEIHQKILSTKLTKEQACKLRDDLIARHAEASQSSL